MPRSELSASAQWPCSRVLLQSVGEFHQVKVCMRTRIYTFILGWLMSFSMGVTWAEDIDIFVTGQDATSTAPSVLIILDNTANWNTAFVNEMAALKSAVNGISTGRIKLGLMMFTETGSGNTGDDGGYVRAAIRTLSADSGATKGYKSLFLDLITSFDSVQDRSNGGKAAMAMIEAYRYFSAGTPISGNKKAKTDYTGNSSGTSASNAIWALTGNALTSKTASTYVSPLSGQCAKTFIIYVSNGAAQDNTSDIRTAEDALTTAGGDKTAIPISPNGSQDNPADEIARFMFGSSLNTSVYTLDVNKVTTGQGPGWSALLKSMANVSGGRYYDVNSGSAGADISAALNEIFTEIQAVNSAFSSVSLPVSVSSQGSYTNQVFIGQFRPDGDGRPRWQGNLKQYKLGYVNSSLTLVDADGSETVSSTTGFIASCARSFWTPSVVDTYWSGLSPGNQCPEPTGVNYKVSNFPDGPIVEKGGHAYRLRSLTGTRQVKTCNLGATPCTSLVDFNTSLSTSTYTASLFGAADNTERNLLINWSRGTDVDDEDVDANTTEPRPSIHGDVVHSRPVAINYGTDAAPQVVVFFGANDGMLRAINGNRSAAIGSYAAGDEMWSFMPTEFYSSIRRLRLNTPQVSYPTISGGQPKPYGFDGPLTSVTSGSSRWLYAAMRRGGRAYYAFDVTTAASPTLKWKIGCPNAANDTGCTTGFENMGQTWSAAVPLKSSGYNAGSKSMLIMGGGYDTCEDNDASDGCNAATAKGRRVYVLDADTGTLLNTFTTTRSVVADVTVVSDVTTGLAKYAYVADLGGNLYRIDIGSAAPGSWTMTTLASLGCATTTSCFPRRKFHYAPDVVEERGTYYVLLGSGDREKPLTAVTQSFFPNAAAVANHFYAVQDHPTTSTWLSSEASTCGSSVICLNSLLSISGNTTPTSSDLSGKKGWYLNLASKEQVVTSAITIFGAVTFSTSQPQASNTSCTPNLGLARAYNINYLDASTKNGTANRYENLPGGGLPPSPVAGKVVLDDGKVVPFVIGASGQSSLKGQAKPPVATGRAQPGKRVYTIIRK